MILWCRWTGIKTWFRFSVSPSLCVCLGVDLELSRLQSRLASSSRSRSPASCQLVSSRLVAAGRRRRACEWAGGARAIRRDTLARGRLRAPASACRRRRRRQTRSEATRAKKKLTRLIGLVNCAAYCVLAGFYTWRLWTNVFQNPARLRLARFCAPAPHTSARQGACVPGARLLGNSRALWLARPPFCIRQARRARSLANSNARRPHKYANLSA